jgi:hypothetical protein
MTGRHRLGARMVLARSPSALAPSQRKPLQNWKSRRPDSNRGPLHYEGSPAGSAGRTCARVETFSDFSHGTDLPHDSSARPRQNHLSPEPEGRKALRRPMLAEISIHPQVGRDIRREVNGALAEVKQCQTDAGNRAVPNGGRGRPRADAGGGGQRPACVCGGSRISIARGTSREYLRR